MENKLEIIPEIIREVSYNDKGEEIVRNWIKGKFLGNGSNNKVFEVTDSKTGEIYAAKIVLKSILKKNKDKDQFRAEIRIQRSLKHNNIVKFISYFETDDSYIIILELCDNGSMYNLLKSRKRLTEPEVKYYLSQIIRGLKYLHDNKIIHRDVKLGNILLNDKLEIKICDFGLSTRLNYDDERKKLKCGTPNYIAPEILSPGEVGYSYEVDVWSLGVILYALIIGKPPFETVDVKSTYRRIRDSIYYFPERCNISDEAKDLINKMLQKNPEDRISLNDITNHNFLTNIPKELPITSIVMEPRF